MPCSAYFGSSIMPKVLEYAMQYGTALFYASALSLRYIIFHILQQQKRGGGGKMELFTIVSRPNIGSNAHPTGQKMQLHMRGSSD